MKNKLRECPFCGAEVQRIVGAMKTKLYACENCGALVSFTKVGYEASFDETDRCWNRRVTKS